jgi:hypothetical protein
MWSSGSFGRQWAFETACSAKNVPRSVTPRLNEIRHSRSLTRSAFGCATACSARKGDFDVSFRRPEGLLHPVSSDNLEFTAAFLLAFG